MKRRVSVRIFPVYYFKIMATEPARQRPLTYWIGEGGGWLLRHVVSGLAATGITPNMFTFLGLAVNSWAAVLFAMGRFRQAAAVLFLAGFLDMADGQVARRVGRVTAFGAFLDSTLDRYSDLALYMGLVVYYTLIGRSFYMALAAVAMASSFMVSYSRARAESLIPLCKVGFLERPGASGSVDYGWRIQPHGPSALGHRDIFHYHRNSPRHLYLAGTSRGPHSSGRQPHLRFFRRIFFEGFFYRRRHNILHFLP